MYPLLCILIDNSNETYSTCKCYNHYTNQKGHIEIFVVKEISDIKELALCRLFLI